MVQLGESPTVTSEQGFVDCAIASTVGSNKILQLIDGSDHGQCANLLLHNSTSYPKTQFLME